MSTPTVDPFAPPFVEGRMTFDFAPGVTVSRYDGWIPEPSVKKVDFVAVESAGLLFERKPEGFLIEVKDFHGLAKIGHPNPENYTGLAGTFFHKINDTLGGLKTTAADASAEQRKRDISNRLIAVVPPQAVLHFEPYDGSDPLFDYLKSTPANLLITIQQSLLHIAPNPIVLSKATTPTAGVPWSVR